MRIEIKMVDDQGSWSIIITIGYSENNEHSLTHNETQCMLVVMNSEQISVYSTEF